MLILVSQLAGRPVIGFDDAEPLGVLRDPIIDPSNGKVVGYFVGYGFMSMKQCALLAEDIVGYDEARVIIQGQKSLQPLEEVPQLRKIANKKIPVLDAKVITESGKQLGRANDLLIDTDLHMVVRYYVHGLMNDRIIAAEQVNRIEKHGIIVDDTAPAAPAAAAEAN